MQRRRKLTIIHTNDIHSHFEQMPRIAAFIERERAASGADGVLALDIGDHMDRMRMETEGSEGAVNIAVLNETGYEAVTLGNNEGLTLTADVLAQRYKEAKFQVVCANLPLAESGRLPDWMTPYHIVVKEGLRIGLIGVTAYFPDVYNLLGWDIRRPIDTVAELARQLRPEVDLLVVMSHLGLKHDETMAKEVPELDLILGGHTHHLLEQPLVVGSTYIAAAGKHGQYAGRIEVEFDPEAGGITVTGRCVAMSDYPESSEAVQSLIDAYGETSRRKLSRVVASLSEPMTNDWYAESPLGNLLAAGLRKWADAEVGIVNSGQLLDKLQTGNVSYGRLHEICPSPINPCRMMLTGEHIAQALEESLLEEFKRKPIFGFGFRGKVLGALCVAGIEVDYDPAGPDYRKVKAVLVNGEPLDKSRTYAVGTIDMFSFGIGYISLSKDNRPAYFVPQFIRDVLEKELGNQAAREEAAVKHWHAHDTE